MGEGVLQKSTLCTLSQMLTILNDPLYTPALEFRCSPESGPYPCCISLPVLTPSCGDGRIILGKNDAIDELAPVSRNNDQNEPSGRQLTLRYSESSISIACGASIRRYRYHLTWLHIDVCPCSHHASCSLQEFEAFVEAYKDDLHSKCQKRQYLVGADDASQLKYVSSAYIEK